jgi:hypothetical protein
MRKGNDNPHVLVGSATWWCTPSQNLCICLQMISGMEHQQPLCNEYKALRNMSYLCVLCPKGHTFFCSTMSTNQSLGGIFALLATFLCLFAYFPSHMSETMSSIVSMTPRVHKIGKNPKTPNSKTRVLTQKIFWSNSGKMVIGFCS